MVGRKRLPHVDHVGAVRARIDGAAPFADNEVAITFDDGYASLDWAAAPVLT